MMKRALLPSALLFALIPAPMASFAAPGSRTAGTSPSQAEIPQAIDPKAANVLREMGSYLSSLQTFQVQTEAADGVVLRNGAKIQTISNSLITLRRPNALRSEQVGPGARMSAWYDGKKLTVYCKTLNTYGTVPAPPSIDNMLDMARKTYGIEAPASDLAFNDPYDVLMENAKSGQYLGIESVDGVPSHHLAFQQDDVDWQIWVTVGPQPLPRRYVITSKKMASQPEFTVRLMNWNTAATLPATAFEPKLPAGAKRVDKLPSTCPVTR